MNQFDDLDELRIFIDQEQLNTARFDTEPTTLLGQIKAAYKTWERIYPGDIPTAIVIPKGKENALRIELAEEINDPGMYHLATLHGVRLFFRQEHGRIPLVISDDAIQIDIQRIRPLARGSR